MNRVATVRVEVAVRGDTNRQDTILLLELRLEGLLAFDVEMLVGSSSSTWSKRRSFNLEEDRLHVRHGLSTPLIGAPSRPAKVKPAVRQAWRTASFSLTYPPSYDVVLGSSCRAASSRHALSNRPAGGWGVESHRAALPSYCSRSGIEVLPREATAMVTWPAAVWRQHGYPVAGGDRQSVDAYELAARVPGNP